MAITDGEGKTGDDAHALGDMPHGNLLSLSLPDGRASRPAVSRFRQNMRSRDWSAADSGTISLAEIHHRERQPMNGAVIYTSALCGFCHRARRLLKQKGAEITEIDVTFSPAKRAEMMKKSGRTSVPQIWIGNHHVGGADELLALEESGRLDSLLEATG